MIKPIFVKIKKLVNVYKLILMLLTLLIGNKNYSQEWTLEKCFETASAHNKTMQIEKNKILMNHEKEKSSYGALLPKIKLQSEYKYFFDLPTQLMPMSIFGGPEGQYKEAQFGVHHNINGQVLISMPLYNSQTFGAIQITKLATQIQELQYEKTNEQVYFEIANLYYNAQLLQQQIIFLDSNIINTSKISKIVQLLHEHKMALQTDVDKIVIQYQQLTLQKEMAQSKYEQVMNALKISMGLPIDSSIRPQSEINITQNIDFIIESKVPIEIQLSRLRTKVTATELKTMHLSRLPTINLIGSYGTVGFGYDKQPNDFLNFYPTSFAGVQLTWPLFNGTEMYRKINEKKLELQNNKLQEEILSDQMLMQRLNAQNQRVLALKSIETSKMQIHLAMDVYQKTLLQKKQNTATLSDVIMADAEVQKAQHQYLSALIDYLKSELELKKLNGVLTQYE